MQMILVVMKGCDDLACIQYSVPGSRGIAPIAALMAGGSTWSSTQAVSPG